MKLVVRPLDDRWVLFRDSSPFQTFPTREAAVERAQLLAARLRGSELVIEPPIPPPRSPTPPDRPAGILGEARRARAAARLLREEARELRGSSASPRTATPPSLPVEDEAALEPRRSVSGASAASTPRARTRRHRSACR